MTTSRENPNFGLDSGPVLVSFLQSWPPEEQEKILRGIFKETIHAITSNVKDLYNILKSTLPDRIKVVIFLDFTTSQHLNALWQMTREIEMLDKSDDVAASYLFRQTYAQIPDRLKRHFLNAILDSYPILKNIDSYYSLREIIQYNPDNENNVDFLIKHVGKDVMTRIITDTTILSYALHSLIPDDDKIRFIFELIDKHHFKKMILDCRQLQHLNIPSTSKRQLIFEMYTKQEMKALLDDAWRDSSAFDTIQVLHYTPVDWQMDLLDVKMLENKIIHWGDFAHLLNKIDATNRLACLQAFNIEWIANISTLGLRIAIKKHFSAEFFNAFTEIIKNYQSQIAAKNNTVDKITPNSTVSAEELREIQTFIDRKECLSDPLASRPNTTQTNHLQLNFFAQDKVELSGQSCLSDTANLELRQNNHIPLAALVSAIILPALIIAAVAWLFKFCKDKMDAERHQLPRYRKHE